MAHRSLLGCLLQFPTGKTGVNEGDFTKTIPLVSPHSLSSFHASEVSQLGNPFWLHLQPFQGLLHPCLSMRCSRNLSWEGWSQQRGFFPLSPHFWRLQPASSWAFQDRFSLSSPLMSELRGCEWVVSILCLSVGPWAPREHIHTPKCILLLTWRQWGHELFISSPGSAFSTSASPTPPTWAGLEPFLPHLLSRLALLQPSWPVNSGYFLPCKFRIFPFRLHTGYWSTCCYFFVLWSPPMQHAQSLV